MLGKKLMFLLLAGAALLACSHTPAPTPPPPPAPAPCPVPEPIRVRIRASDRLNPGENGESLATTVRLYQLKDAGKLEGATLEQILDNDRAVLADDLVSVSELTLYPGETATPSLGRREGGAYLAVVAFFRHPSGSAWRVVSKVPPQDAEHCHTPDGGSAEAVRFALRFGLVETRIEFQ